MNEDLILMTMKNSKVVIDFAADAEDPFLIHVLKYRKSGKLFSDAMIIRPDLDQYINIFQREGFFCVPQNV